MTRREIIKYTAWATGAAVSAPLVSTLLSGCKTEPSTGSLPETLHFFSKDGFALVKELADLILPKTDSPSASEVGVPELIDRMVGTAYPEKAQADFKAGFDSLQQSVAAAGFDKLDASGKLEWLKTLLVSPDGAPQKALLDLKQQTIAFYLTTKEIGTQFLNYLPVPGQYEPCITLDAAGNKAWAI